MNFNDEFKKYQDSLLADTIKLLSIESVLIEQPEITDAPFGDAVRDSLLFMLDKAKEDGFKTCNIDNVAGHIEYGEGEEIFAVLTHLDVVPAGKGWDTHPFEPTIKDGKIYARGIIDDKGPTMSAYYALKMLKDNNIKLNKRVRLIMGTDEETSWRGIYKYLEKEETPHLGFCPDADFPLIYGEKAITTYEFNGVNDNSDIISIKSQDRTNVVPDYVEVVIRRIDLKDKFLKYLEDNNFKGEVKQIADELTLISRGVNAHAMCPEKGVNALSIMFNFLSNHVKSNMIDFICNYLTDDIYGKKLGIDKHTNELGDLTMNFAIVELQHSEFRIAINLRIPNDVILSEMQVKVKTIATECGINFAQVGPEVEVHYVDKQSDLVQTLLKSYQKYTNDFNTPPMTIGGGTYSRVISNCCAFGPLFPGREDCVHQPNEHQDLEDFYLSCVIYADAIYNLCR